MFLLILIVLEWNWIRVIILLYIKGYYGYDFDYKLFIVMNLIGKSDFMNFVM